MKVLAVVAAALGLALEAGAAGIARVPAVGSRAGATAFPASAPPALASTPGLAAPAAARPDLIQAVSGHSVYAAGLAAARSGGGVSAEGDGRGSRAGRMGAKAAAMAAALDEGTTRGAETGAATTGPETAAPKAPAPARWHLLPPVRHSVELSPARRAAYAGSRLAAMGFFKIYLPAVISPWGPEIGALIGLGWAALRAPFTWAEVTMATRFDLAARFWGRRRALLKSLRKTPGLEEIKILTTTGGVRYKAFLVAGGEAARHVFVKTSGPPPGAAPLPEPREQKLMLRLMKDGRWMGPAWRTDLRALLEGDRMPELVAWEWNERMSASRRGKGLLRRAFERALAPGWSVRAILVGADGRWNALGDVAEGPGVDRMVARRSVKLLDASPRR